MRHVGACSQRDCQSLWLHLQNDYLQLPLPESCSRWSKLPRHQHLQEVSDLSVLISTPASLSLGPSVTVFKVSLPSLRSRAVLYRIQPI